jgi:hypothetical protein
MNVERAYREFRNEPPDAPWDTAGTFDAIYQVAKAKGSFPDSVNRCRSLKTHQNVLFAARGTF